MGAAKLCNPQGKRIKRKVTTPLFLENINTWWMPNYATEDKNGKKKGYDAHIFGIVDILFRLESKVRVNLL